MQLGWVSSERAQDDGHSVAFADISQAGLAERPGECVLRRVFTTQQVTFDFYIGHVVAIGNLQIPRTAVDMISKQQQQLPPKQNKPAAVAAAALSSDSSDSSEEE